MRNTSHDEEKSCGVHLINVIFILFYFIFNELQILLNNFFVIVDKQKTKNKNKNKNKKIKKSYLSEL